jgi:hypothetical protein
VAVAVAATGRVGVNTGIGVRVISALVAGTSAERPQPASIVAASTRPNNRSCLFMNSNPLSIFDHDVTTNTKTRRMSVSVSSTIRGV